MLRLSIATTRNRLLPETRSLTTCVSLHAKSSRSQAAPTPELLDPAERLKHLRSAEKRVAVFAGVSLIVGYFALKFSFRKMATSQSQAATAAGQGSSPLPRPLVIAGPSGSGKSTLLNLLLKEYPDNFGFSVSHTTRKPRPGEVDGKAYHFTTREAMKKSIDQGNFIEWAEYSGNMYGTSKQAVMTVQNEGKVCVLDIDMQGVRNLKKTDLNPIYMFIRPPSMEELERRLRHRDTETEESLKKRMDTAREEIEYAETPGVFDHVVVNGTVDAAYLQMKTAIAKDIGIIEVAVPSDK